MNLISVIICAYTEARWDDLAAAVDSVRAQSIPAETIVVIDHNDQLLRRARERFADATVIANDGPRGLSGARNSGVAAAGGELIAFLDDDARAAPDWLARLAAAYADPLALGAGGAIRPRWPESRPRWFPAEFDWVVGCTYAGMPAAPAPVRNLIGCNMSFRREVFELIGGFRIGRVGVLSIGQENDETELCIRLGMARPAAKLIYLPAAAVDHAVTPERTRLRYFVRRCYSEGLSKAALSRQLGSQRSLESERGYVAKTLPAGVLRGLGDALLRRDPAGALRALAIVGGLAVTAAGYLQGRLRALRRPRPAGAQPGGPATAEARP